MKIFWLIIVWSIYAIPSHAQASIMSEEQTNLFDSLQNRIKQLENELPRLKRTRAYNLYFKKQEYEKTLFAYAYEKLVFDEDLLQAEMILNAKARAAIKRNDKSLIDYYKNYHHDLNGKMKTQSERYEQLFSKEKIFKKALYKFINVGDEYNVLRAERMVDLALKYAEERKLSSTLEYLAKYKRLVTAEVFDFYSEYDLMVLASSKSQYNKQIEPLIESDSLSDILEAQEIINNCYNYSTIINTNLNSEYFGFQQNRVLKAISDYHTRQGDLKYMEEYADQAVLAKLDSLNQKGIYRWKDYIIVIDELNPNAQFKNVRKGEAIIHADHKLIEYVRVNRLANIGKEVEVGPTVLIPFSSKDGPVNFHFNSEAEKWQYIICYTKIKNHSVTKQVNAYLPPLEFEDELQEN